VKDFVWFHFRGRMPGVCRGSWCGNGREVERVLFGTCGNNLIDNNWKAGKVEALIRHKIWAKWRCSTTALQFHWENKANYKRDLVWLTTPPPPPSLPTRESNTLETVDTLDIDFTHGVESMKYEKNKVKLTFVKLVRACAFHFQLQWQFGRQGAPLTNIPTAAVAAATATAWGSNNSCSHLPF